MSDHMTDAEYEASAILKQSAHESQAFERSDAAKVAAVAALAKGWSCNCGGPSPEGHHEMHCDSYYGDRLRTALADPDAALERVRAEARAEALRGAAETPAAMRVNTEGNATGREWLLFRADEAVQS